jgi:hypothetical protein
MRLDLTKALLVLSLCCLVSVGLLARSACTEVEATNAKERATKNHRYKLVSDHVTALDRKLKATPPKTLADAEKVLGPATRCSMVNQKLGGPYLAGWSFRWEIATTEVHPVASVGADGEELITVHLDSCDKAEKVKGVTVNQPSSPR